MKLSRIVRLIKLIGLLQLGRGQSARALADSCRVSRRTIFRDLNLLREAGVPLVYDDQLQQHRIPGTYFLPPTNFAPEEALALLVLCHELGDATGLPFHGPARSAALKLESSLPAKLREYLRGVSDAVRIQLGPGSALDDQEPVYRQLLGAIAQRRCVRIWYGSLTEWKEICTRLSPYRLLFSRRSWYVVGRSSLHRAVRTFNVRRIRRMEVLPDRFKIPRGFSIQRVLRNAWHLIPEPGPDYHVVVRFEKMVAQNVGEVVWHKTQRLEFLDDGRLDFHVTVSGLNEISWWILGYGDQAEVLQPPKLRQIITDRTRRLLERYQKSTSAGRRSGARGSA